MMKTILSFILFSLCFNLFAYEVTREAKTQFPRCVDGDQDINYNLFFKWTDRHIDRTVEVYFSKEPCRTYKQVLSNQEIVWTAYKEVTRFIPTAVVNELKQIEQKTHELRAETEAVDFLAKHPINVYTKETNRELTKRYGQLFSAQVFRAWIESKKENHEFKDSILKNLRTLKKSEEKPFAALSDRVKIVVSFGLGWEEKYNRTTPFYIKNFIADIKSLGLPVLFLKKNPFGKVNDNIEKIIPSLESELDSGKDLVLISLCKGTPELLAAEAELGRQNKRGKILGHVNLSGMLSGAIFSDFAQDIVLPKVVAPLMKLIPFDSVRDSARMVDAIEYMKTSVIESALQTATPDLDKSIFYVNITGAPMTTYVFEGKSPMRPILTYNVVNEFVDSANDGFLEMPSTLIPESVSHNQVSLILDSSHLLSDGMLNEFKIEDENNRRILYYTVVKTILEREPVTK